MQNAHGGSPSVVLQIKKQLSFLLSTAKSIFSFEHRTRSMKSGPAKFKVVGRHRRRLSKNGVVNGGGPVVRQQVPSALSDHIYANCSVPVDDLVSENMQLHHMVKSRLGMIGQWQEELDSKALFNDQLSDGVMRRDQRMCIQRCKERVQPQTRYIGRKSKTVPSRALKRRYICPPKPLSKQAPAKKDVPSPKEAKVKANDYLSTQNDTPEPPLPSPSDVPTHIDVPLWKLKPVTSFYQMEGTENINDVVFERRHQKYELDERRRKRWDLQRLREQKARSERHRKKREREDSTNPATFLPDPQHMEAIEVCEQVPVMAFGHPIPTLHPCEFSLPWSPDVARRRGRPPTLT